jgi:hypothetical protein
MRVVEKAERSPKRCAFSGVEKGPLVDFQVEVHPRNVNEPNNLYLRAGIVEEAAKLLGMVPKREVDNLIDQLAAHKAELDQLRADMELYAEFEERFGGKSPADVLDDMKASVA